MSDDSKKRLEALSGTIDQVAGKGAAVEVNPADAQALGAFEEDALSLQDALDSRFDNDDESEADDE